MGWGGGEGSLGSAGTRLNQRTSLGPGPACETKSGSRASAPAACLPEVWDPWGLPSPHQHVSGLKELQVSSTSPSRAWAQDRGQCGRGAAPPAHALLVGCVASWQRFSSPRGKGGLGALSKGLLCFLRLSRGVALDRP